MEIQTSTAIWLSIIYTTIYVGVLYVSHSTRPRRDLPRDSPAVIQNRIRAVLLATLLCFVVSLLVILSTGQSFKAALPLLGIWPVTTLTILDIFRSIFLVAILFSAPLLDKLMGVGDLLVDIKNEIHWALQTWIGWRNHVIAPLTEELVFRACVIPLYILAGTSPTSIVFWSPLCFGIAHIHHAYEFYLKFPDSILRTIVRSMVQFSYTTIFGWFETFLFLRTGSIWAVILVHAFCNWMGLPTLMLSGVSWERHVLYTSALVGGAFGFYTFLWRLTESTNALIKVF